MDRTHKFATIGADPYMIVTVVCIRALKMGSPVYYDYNDDILVSRNNANQKRCGLV